MKDFKILKEPLTRDEILNNLKEGYIKGIIPVHIDDLLNTDLGDFLNLISERLIGDSLLTDIEYNVVGHSGKTHILIEVSGDPSESLDFNEDEDADEDEDEYCEE